MDLNSRKFGLILICSLTIVLVLLSSQYLFAYEKEIKGISATITESMQNQAKRQLQLLILQDFREM